MSSSEIDSGLEKNLRKGSTVSLFTYAKRHQMNQFEHLLFPHFVIFFFILQEKITAVYVVR